MYCWSSGGSDYARQAAAELGIEDCFIAFLPKPNLMIDDQPVSAWNRFLHVDPLSCSGDVAAYRKATGVEE